MHLRMSRQDSFMFTGILLFGKSFPFSGLCCDRFRSISCFPSHRKSWAFTAVDQKSISSHRPSWSALLTKNSGRDEVHRNRRQWVSCEISWNRQIRFCSEIFFFVFMKLRNPQSFTRNRNLGYPVKRIIDRVSTIDFVASVTKCNAIKVPQLKCSSHKLTI